MFKLLCYVTFPVAVVKAMIALLQGYEACLNMGTIDVCERAEIRKAKAQ
jgi:hypothetical protein